MKKTKYNSKRKFSILLLFKIALFSLLVSNIQCTLFTIKNPKIKKYKNLDYGRCRLFHKNELSKKNVFRKNKLEYFKKRLHNLGIYDDIDDHYNIKVTTYTLYIEDLPKDFDGFTIGSFTDLHIGYMNSKKLITIYEAFKNHPIVKRRLSKNQKPFDTLFFLGDLLNYKLNEINEYKIKILQKFNNLSKTGIYSIIGNHDLDGYSFFSEKTPEKDFDKKMEAVHEILGWKLLKNSHDIIKKNNQFLKILGIDHWGACTALRNRGSIEKAKAIHFYTKKNTPINPNLNILLAHDPSIFDEVKLNHKDIFLVLSGHTHGLKTIGEGLHKTRWNEMGFSLKKIKKALPFSTWRCTHKYYKGKYTSLDGKQTLIVDEGVGYGGVSKDLKIGKNKIQMDFLVTNRSGVTPNISIIILKSKNNKFLKLK